MKFAYVAAALLGLAYGHPVVSEAPETDSLALHEAREIEDIKFLAERDEEDIALFDALDEVLNAFDERDAEAEAEFDDQFEEEPVELEARSERSILGALKNVNKHVGSVDKALNKFKGSQKPTPKQALAVQTAGKKLASAIDGATGAAKKSKKLNKGDSEKVFKYVAGPLKGATFKSLDDFIKHRSGFKKAGFSGVVKNNLESLKGKVGGLAKALLAKAGSKSVVSKGKKVAKQIAGKFDQAIKAF